MIKIKRTCTNKIISRALDVEDQPLVAILRPGADDCEPCLDLQQLEKQLSKYTDAIIVYNQHADSAKLIDKLSVLPDQVFIEIRQDTRGVLGLHAIRRHRHQQETLELIYR